MQQSKFMEVMGMHGRAFVVLLMVALTVPFGIFGIFGSKFDYFLAGIGLYLMAGFLVPTIYYVVQKNGWGKEYGIFRAIAHVPVWYFLGMVKIAMVMHFSEQNELLWKYDPYFFMGINVISLSFLIMFSLELDYWIACLLYKIKKKILGR